MKVYVAGKFEQKKRVRALMAALVERGHEITHDWTHEDATGKTGADLATYLNKCAGADVRGVETADALVIIRHDRGKGLYVELGIAIARRIPIYAIGDCDVESCIFLKLARVKWFTTEAEMFAFADRGEVLVMPVITGVA